MIKHIVESQIQLYADSTMYDKQIVTEMGIFQIIEWINLDYKLPDQSGVYLVANNEFCGNSKYLHFVKNKFIIELSNKFNDMPQMYWHESGDPLTDKEKLDVVWSRNVWYYMNASCSEYYIVVFKDSPGQYWIDPKLLSGPYQRDLDSLPIHVTDF